MIIKTISAWDEIIWQDVSPLYFEAFGEKGAKPVKIIKNMFSQGIAELHVGYKDMVPVGMSLTGKLLSQGVMIIDYLAVTEKERGQGLGKKFVDYLRHRAVDKGYKMIVIEAESENTQENIKRIHFWQSYGFLLTEYVHHYIWVPETYHAMYFPLKTISREVKGEELFVYINQFHRLSFRGE